MFKYVLADKNGIPVDVHCGLDDHPTLMAESHRTLSAHWRSSSITTATTTTVVTAREGQSLALTDVIVILSKKVASATIIIRFSDGTNTVNMFTLDAGESPFQFSHDFMGGLRGWKDADLQVVTDDATTLSVLVGYVHISSKTTKTYNEWDAGR